MSKVVMLNGMVAVEKVTADTESAQESSLFRMPGIRENTGRVKFLSANSSIGIKEGDLVYFGVEHSQVRMRGFDVLVMKESNIVALVQE